MKDVKATYTPICHHIGVYQLLHLPLRGSYNTGAAAISNSDCFCQLTRQEGASTALASGEGVKMDAGSG